MKGINFSEFSSTLIYQNFFEQYDDKEVQLIKFRSPYRYLTSLSSLRFRSQSRGIRPIFRTFYTLVMFIFRSLQRPISMKKQEAAFFARGSFVLHRGHVMLPFGIQAALVRRSHRSATGSPVHLIHLLGYITLFGSISNLPLFLYTQLILSLYSLLNGTTPYFRQEMKDFDILLKSGYLFCGMNCLVQFFILSSLERNKPFLLQSILRAKKYQRLISDFTLLSIKHFSKIFSRVNSDLQRTTGHLMGVRPLRSARSRPCRSKRIQSACLQSLWVTGLMILLKEMAQSRSNLFFFSFSEGEFSLSFRSRGPGSCFSRMLLQRGPSPCKLLEFSASMKFLYLRSTLKVTNTFQFSLRSTSVQAASFLVRITEVELVFQTSRRASSRLVICDFLTFMIISSPLLNSQNMNPNMSSSISDILVQMTLSLLWHYQQMNPDLFSWYFFHTYPIEYI